MKLKHKVFLGISGLIIGLLISLASANIPLIDKTINILEEKNGKEALDKTYKITSYEANRIKAYRQKALSNHKEELKVVVQIVEHILKSYYDRYKQGKITEAKAKQDAYVEINSLRYGKNGYFFVFDDTYHVVAHANKKLIGAYMYDKKDTKGTYFAREMLDKTRINKEAFTHYWWAKIKGKEYEKLSYTKAFEPWNIYIGTGVYIDDIKDDIDKQIKELKARLTNIMKNTHIGKTGYIYIFNKKGEMVIHPDKNLLGDKFKYFINNDTGNPLYKDLMDVADSENGLHYKWNKLNDKTNYTYTKISWVKYEPKFGWYVASSAYVDEFENTSEKLMSMISARGATFTIITLLLSILFMRMILSPLQELLDTVDSIKNGDYHARANVNSKDEIGELANGFNSMAEKIEENITILDKKVNEKTQELRLANKTLEEKVDDAIKETQQKEKLLQEQSRLAQMGEMISMIAHQWRQPLGAISSAIIGIQTKQKIGKFDLSDEADREQFLVFCDKKYDNINGYVQFLSTTIDDFRNFFKPDKSAEMVPLNTPVEKALQIVGVSMKNKGTELETIFDSKDEVEIFQNETMQVILNILKNAEDNFVDKNISNPKIIITTSRKDNEFKITIQDNGGGIPEDIIGNIFDPYFSTKNEKNGTGLGLYMSKTIIEEHHDGRLSVSNQNDGAYFEIVINN